MENLYIDINKLETIIEEHGEEDITKRVYLHCRFKDKDSIRNYGGRWDTEKKRWFYNPDYDSTQPDKLKQWTTPEQIRYCNIKYDDRNTAKQAGLSWFKDKKRWGHFASDPVNIELLKTIVVR